MSPLQFSLFFVALLVAYILMHVRLVRFERYLREISGLKQLNDRMAGVSDVLKRLSVHSLEDRVDQVHGELRQLVAAVGRMERALRDHTTVEPVIGAEVPYGARLRAMIEERLIDNGFTDIRIVTDLGQTQPEQEVEVMVECQKDQVAHKGRLLVAAGSILRVNLRSVTQSFP